MRQIVLIEGASDMAKDELDGFRGRQNLRALACSVCLAILGSRSPLFGGVGADSDFRLTETLSHEIGLCPKFQISCNTLPSAQEAVVQQLIARGFKLQFSWSQTRLFLRATRNEPLPDGISELQETEALTIDGGGFLRKLPAGIFSLPKLSELHLENFVALDSLEFPRDSKIAHMRIQNSEIERLPPSLIRLEQLASLHLSGNRLGKLPAKMDSFVGRLDPSWKFEQRHEAPWNVFPEVPRHVFETYSEYQRLLEISTKILPPSDSSRVLDFGQPVWLERKTDGRKRAVFKWRTTEQSGCDGMEDSIVVESRGLLYHSSGPSESLLFTGDRWSMHGGEIRKGLSLIHI